MLVHPLAGKPVPPHLLVDLPKLLTAYYTQPASEPVAFGTSGHRGSSLNGSFNELHILAIAQAIAELRKPTCSGPLFVGKDTHALSEPAEASALEVLAANGVEVVVAAGGGYTPTPVISHAILAYNRARQDRFGDGIVITPSHNPPEDGGFKYNPPHGGPAEEALTKRIEVREIGRA